MIVDRLLFPKANLTKTEKTLITVGEVVGVLAVISAVDDRVQKRKREKLMQQQQLMYQQWYMQHPGQATGGFPTMPGPAGTNTVNTGMPSPGGGLTYAPATYDNIADAIESDLQTSFGEDWDDVVTQMKKIKTADDYNALVNAFGDRSNYSFGVAKYTEGLAYWLNDEMGGSDQLKSINSHLAKFGVQV